MRRSVIYVLLVLVVGIAATILLRSPLMERRDSNAPAGSETTKLNDHESSSGTKKSSTRTVTNPDIVIVGRKPYDTGIANDRRVQEDDEGRHVVIEAVQIAKTLHLPEGSVEEDLEYIEHILGIYRLSFEQNPVAGDNQMVMQALLGENPRDLVVFPSDHPSINSKGELVDRWGNPYFFHALSGTEMEIFSAGPDGEFNTADDVQRSDRNGLPLTGAELETESDVGP